MDGVRFAGEIERLLRQQGISKGKFYQDVGVTATALYGWRNGAEPKKETVKRIGEYLGVDFGEIQPTIDPETAALLSALKDRQDLRILLHSAKEIPPSSVYNLIAQLEKQKEDDQ